MITTAESTSPIGSVGSAVSENHVMSNGYDVKRGVGGYPARSTSVVVAEVSDLRWRERGRSSASEDIIFVNIIVMRRMENGRVNVARGRARGERKSVIMLGNVVSHNTISGYAHRPGSVVTTRSPGAS